MTDDERRKLFYEGKDLWFEYIRINGYSWSPKDEGIRKLSKLLALSGAYIRKCINVYLEA